MVEGNIELPAEKAYYLLRTQIIQDIQAQLFAWAKQRVWIASAVAAIVGFFGINAIVTVSLYNLMREDLRAAQKASVIASEAADKAKSAIKTANSHVEILRARAKDVDDRFSTISGKLEAESTNAREAALKEVELLNEKLTALESLIAKVAKDTETTRVALTEYRSTTEKQKKIADSRRDEFTQNSQFYVHTYFMPSSAKTGKAVVERLSKLGFKTSVQERDKIPKKTVIVYGRDGLEKAKQIQGIVSQMLDNPNVSVQEEPLRPISVSPKGPSAYGFSKDHIGVFLWKE